MKEAGKDGISSELEFRHHSNGGGLVCSDSKVRDEVYIGPKVTVIRSNLYCETCVSGEVRIEDSEICNSIVDSGKAGAISIINCHFNRGTLRGSVKIRGCFLVSTEIEASKNIIDIEYFYLMRSYLSGSISLKGESVLGPHGQEQIEYIRESSPWMCTLYTSRYPYSLCPKILCSHIEGEITLVLPHKTEITSAIIKPEDVSLKAYPNKTALEGWLSSIPLEHQF